MIASYVALTLAYPDMFNLPYAASYTNVSGHSRRLHAQTQGRELAVPCLRVAPRITVTPCGVHRASSGIDRKGLL